jgi:UDPglucose 6-dehydrogenase
VLKNILIILFCFSKLTSDTITVIGAGQVGLVLGSIFSNFGHQVTFVEVDEIKLNQLKKGLLPIKEPGLELIFHEGVCSNKISFTNRIDSIENLGIVFICTNTPSDLEGNLNDIYILEALDAILSTSHAPKAICIKSTLMPGMMQKFQDYVFKRGFREINLIYNPEFMREGSAISDILTINPIVLGAERQDLIDLVLKCYNHLPKTCEVIRTNFMTAELIKMAWNGFSALRITYINELSRLCQTYEADISKITHCIAQSEVLLPTKEIKPGCGFGGSCFPKDTLALSHIFERIGLRSSLIHQVIYSNNQHIDYFVDQIIKASGPFRAKVAVMGIGFKANTSDIRNSPAKKALEELKKKGFVIQCYDPNATENMKKEFAYATFFDFPEAAIAGSDCLVILNDSKEIASLSLDEIAKIMNKKNIIDTKNVFDPCFAKKLGFEIINSGKL